MNEKALNEKTEVLSRLIMLSAELYKEVNDSQKAFMETLIGAGIWYLPSDKNLLFDGKISEAALNALKTDTKITKLVEEHGRMPRKLAGKALHDDYIEKINTSGDRLKELYLTEFGKFNYVLKSENDSLAKHQRGKTFKGEEAAYKSAGIKMIPITLEEVKRLKKEQALRIKQVEKN